MLQINRKRNFKTIDEVTDQEEEENQLETVSSSSFDKTPPAKLKIMSNKTIPTNPDIFYILSNSLIYDTKIDPRNCKYLLAALLNTPFSLNLDTYVHPRIHALVELVNQQKASIVFNQYNYADILPIYVDPNDESNITVAKPFEVLTGVYNQHVREIFRQHKEIERELYLKSFAIYYQKVLLTRVLKKIKNRAKYSTSNGKLSIATSLDKIVNIFINENNKPELFYSENSVYLRSLSPTSVL